MNVQDANFALATEVARRMAGFADSEDGPLVARMVIALFTGEEKDRDCAGLCKTFPGIAASVAMHLFFEDGAKANAAMDRLPAYVDGQSSVDVQGWAQLEFVRYLIRKNLMPDARELINGMRTSEWRNTASTLVMDAQTAAIINLKSSQSQPA